MAQYQKKKRQIILSEKYFTQVQIHSLYKCKQWYLHQRYRTDKGTDVCVHSATLKLQYTEVVAQISRKSRVRQSSW